MEEVRVALDLQGKVWLFNPSPELLSSCPVASQILVALYAARRGLVSPLARSTPLLLCGWLGYLVRQPVHVGPGLALLELLTLCLT